MTTIIAALEFKNDDAIAAFFGLIVGGAVIVGIFVRGARSATLHENVKLLARQMRELQRKLDALLKHQGIEMPSPTAIGMSPEVEQLAKHPKTKIAAIKLYREENPGIGLREAKELIEAIYRSKK